MNDIVLYCKSYLPDLNRVMNLIDSIDTFNVDRIPVYISVPKDHVHQFKTKLSNAVNIIEDEMVYEGKLHGWLQQQVVKSQFWKTEISKNYVCIDSDSYFIRPFTTSDFMVDVDTPYTVMHEQKELFTWAALNRSRLGFDPKGSFVNDRREIMKIFERASKVYDFGPSPVIWSTLVWKALDENYIIPNKLTLEQLISHIPSEFSWYGESLMKFNPIPIYPVEPIFKVFHYEEQYIDYKQAGITEEQISENYMGIVMQSNYKASLRY